MPSSLAPVLLGTGSQRYRVCSPWEVIHAVSETAQPFIQTRQQRRGGASHYVNAIAPRKYGPQSTVHAERSHTTHVEPRLGPLPTRPNSHNQG